MKQAIFIITLLTQINAHAWTSTSPASKDYHFRYQLNGNSLELSINAPSYEDAFDKAASQCASHYKGQNKLDENAKLDIIDVCANPRS